MERQAALGDNFKRRQPQPHRIEALFGTMSQPFTQTLAASDADNHRSAFVTPIPTAATL
jgi:hypothetical protein